MPPAMASSQLEMTLSVISPRFLSSDRRYNIVVGAESGWSSAYIPVDSMTVEDRYDFDVVFSMGPELLRTSPATVPATIPKPKPAASPGPTSRERNLISSLLKDPTSVDICFTFTSDKACSNIGLWAHRFVLSRHEAFVKLIQEATAIQSLSDMVLAEKDSADGAESDGESISNRSIDTVVTNIAVARGPMVGAASKELVIKIDGVALATFCVMLYYIYTGEVDRTVVPGRFVLSNTNKASLVWRDSTSKVDDSDEWRPLDEDSPWRLKDVTWQELHDAAVHFGIKELQADLLAAFARSFIF
ncbi:hypothetical protein BGW39_005307 [Mortierella sp. 14UC]|nr:hypothetical protein BGW39_005307 [Mortierella sp. 14UC]